MPPAVELLREERLDDLLRDLDARGAPAQRQHVGVVVVARHERRVVVVAQRTAHAIHFVGGDGNADARAAHDDAARGLAARHARADVGANVRVVAPRPVAPGKCAFKTAEARANYEECEYALGVQHFQRCVLAALPDDVKEGEGGAPFIEKGVRRIISRGHRGMS